MRRGVWLLWIAFLGCDAQAPPPPSASDSRDPFGRRREAGGAGELRYGQARAFVVGVTSYGAGSLGSLEGPHFDASEVAATLASRYGFQVTVLLDRPTPGLKAKIGPITAASLRAELKAFCASATANDALLFYFAGHGLPGHLVPGDAVLGSPTEPGTWKNVLPFEELAKTLRGANAHHTLLALDCCFSGTAVSDGVRASVGALDEPVLRVAERDNAARVFNRRAFQIITAGAGDETVADLVQVSRTYAALPKDLAGHSPFTGVLLQGLRGLTGRADGRIPASDLGFYLGQTLVNENESFRAKQSPRYGAIAGEGDFLFLPTGKVLNPKLVGPLYMAGTDYAELRESAADALIRFVAAQRGPDLAPLVGAAVPHLARLLRDAEPGPRRAAAKSLEKAARLVDPAAVPEFREAVAPLAALARDAAQPASAEAAAALGRLGAFADEDAAAALDVHAASTGAAFAAKRGERALPDEVAEKLAAAPSASTVDASLPERFSRAEARRALHAWLLGDGLRLMDDMERRHELGQALLQRAERYAQEKRVVETRLTAARALGEAGLPGDARLIRESPEWWAARRLLDETPDPRVLWSAGHVGHHAFDIAWLDATPDGRRLASLDFAGIVRVWDTSTGKLLREFERHPGLEKVVWSGAGDLLLQLARDGTIRVVDPFKGSPAWVFRTGMPGAGLGTSGMLLAISGGEGETQLYDLAARKWAGALPCHGFAPVRFLDSDHVLIPEYVSGTVSVYRLSTEDLAPLADLGQPFVSLDYDAPSRRVVFVTDDGGVRLWDKGMSKELLPPGEERPPRVMFVNGGASVVVLREDDAVVLDLATGEERPLPDVLGKTRVAATGAAFYAASRHAIHAYDARTWEERGVTRRAAESWKRAAFGPSGRDVFLLGPRVERRDAETGAVLAVADTEAYAFAFVSERALVLVDRLSWSLVDAATLKEIRGGTLPASQVDGVLFGDPLRDRFTLVLDLTVRTIDAATGEELGSWTTGGGRTLLGLDPTGTRAVLSHFKRAVELRDVLSGEVRWIWRRPGELVVHAAFHPFRPELAARDLGGQITRLSTVDGRELSAWKSDSTSDGLAWLPSGDRLAEGTWGEGLAVWDVEQGKVISRAFPALGHLKTPEISPDGTRVVLYGEAGAVIVARLGLGPDAPFDGRLSGTLLPLLAPAGRDSVVVVSDPDADAGGFKEILTELDLSLGLVRRRGPLREGVSTNQVELSPDGARLLRVFYKGRVELVDDGGFGAAKVLQGHEASLCKAGFFGERIVGVDENGAVHRWSEDGRDYSKSDIDETPLAEPDRGAAAAPKAGLMAWIALGGRVVVYDAEKDEVVSEIDADRGSVVLALSPDGSRLVTCGRETRPVLWETLSGKRVLEFGFALNPIAIEFDPAGRRVAMSDPDGMLFVWELPSGRLLRSANGAGEAASLRWLDDGERLLSFSRERLQVWDPRPLPTDLSSWLDQVRFQGPDAEWTGRWIVDTLLPGPPAPVLPAPPTPPLVAAARCRSAGNLLAALRFADAAGAEVPRAWRTLLTEELRDRGRRALLDEAPELALHFLDPIAATAAELAVPRFYAAFQLRQDEKALDCLKSWAAADPVSGGLFRWHVLRRLGRQEEAAKALQDAARSARPGEPLDGLPAVFAGRLAEADLLSLAKGPDKAWILFHLGMDALLRGDVPRARERLAEAAGGEGGAVALARAELARLKPKE